MAYKDDSVFQQCRQIYHDLNQRSPGKPCIVVPGQPVTNTTPEIPLIVLPKLYQHFNEVERGRYHIDEKSLNLLQWPNLMTFSKELIAGILQNLCEMSLKSSFKELKNPYRPN